MTLRRTVPWVVLAALPNACITRDISQDESEASGEVLYDIPLTADIDILFVIDNSPSTSDKQAKFAANFPRFIEALDRFPGGRPNVHIGVVSSTMQIPATTLQGDLGEACTSAPLDSGRLRHQATVSGCTPPSGRFIRDVANPDGTRTQNYPGGSGQLASTFSCISRIGSDGCAFEHPLGAMKAALDGTVAENAGFLRPGAYLAVIILTDEDDCSARDPALFNLPVAEVGEIDLRCQPRDAYACDQPITLSPGTYTNCAVRRDSFLEDPRELAAFLKGLKRDPNQVVVGLVAGPSQTTIRTGPLTRPFTQELALQPSCQIDDNREIGRPGIRLADFLSGFPGRSDFSSVCANDYSQALSDFGELLFSVASPCLGGALKTDDVDPDAPGTQLACAVSDVSDDGTSAATETILPRCEMADAETPAASGARPCWWVRSNPTSCTGPSSFELHVERSQAPPGNTRVRARCASG
jgi:hypothetical protein